MNRKYLFLLPFKHFLNFLGVKRFRLFLFFLFDFILIYILQNKYFPQDNNFFLIPLLFTLISYFSGRYYSKYTNYKELISKSLIFSFISVLNSFIILFLINNLIFTFNKPNNLIENLTLLTLIFTFVNLFILFINTRNKINHGLWLVKNDHQKIFSSKKIFLFEEKRIKFEKIENFENIDENIKKISGIIICNSSKNQNKFSKKLFDLKRQGISILDSYNWCKNIIKRYPPEIFLENDLYLQFNQKIVNSIYSRIKRVLDIFISFIILILSSPIIVLSCIAIYLEDKGPVFYSQIRTGYLGKEFKIFKIRSMKQNAEPDGAVWSYENDQRTLKFGRFIRSTRIDELPQLLSIIKGEMSLIGPRPERPVIEKKLVNSIPNYMFRYEVKPGLSGWAQVNFPYGSSIEDSKNKLSYDLFYILEYSIFLDILIFFKTIRIIFKRQGSNPKK